MKGSQRRNEIREILVNAVSPLSASLLGSHLAVSRQIIVGDIAILRAEGLNITSTHKGYFFTPNETSNPFVDTLTCMHTPEQMENELYTIVDFGGTVIDVSIDHPVYGQLSGLLNLHSRYDVDQFLSEISNCSTKPLSLLTSGVHFHRVGCKSKEAFDIIKKKLTDLKIIV